MVRNAGKLGWSDVTPKPLWLNRRQLMAGAGALALATPSLLRAEVKPLSPYSTDAPMNTLEDITSYNNYYEFGYGKEDPKAYAQGLTVDPWSIVIDGLVDKPGTYDLADLCKGQTIEERIYRFRCVEAWSMVVPWIGFPLSALINAVQPKGNAKFVEFVTLADKAQMPGLRSGVLDWPYTEGLRMDEAMHPLTLVTLGAFGEVLPNQNGAPIRMTIPWKYGFKGGKSIVKIRFVEKEPKTAWVKAGPSEYGFYSNVNPTVDHARWSQATERRLGEFGKRKSLMFNRSEERRVGKEC